MLQAYYLYVCTLKLLNGQQTSVRMGAHMAVVLWGTCINIWLLQLYGSSADTRSLGSLPRKSLGFLSIHSPASAHVLPITARLSTGEDYKICRGWVRPTEREVTWLGLSLAPLSYTSQMCHLLQTAKDQQVLWMLIYQVLCWGPTVLTKMNSSLSFLCKLLGLSVLEDIHVNY